MKALHISAPYERLFRLIKALSARQKASFRAQTKGWSTQKTGEYVLLYNRMNQYIATGGKLEDIPETIAPRVRDKTKRNQNDARANYLFDRILESQRQAPDRGKLLTQLNGMIQDMYFLHNKSLLVECLHAIDKALPIAIKADRQALILEINDIERRILFNTIIPHHRSRLNALNKRDDIALKALQDLLKIKRLINEIISANRSTSDLNSSILEEIKDLIDTHPQEKFADLPLRNGMNMASLFYRYYNYQSQTNPEKKLHYLQLAFGWQEYLVQLFNASTFLQDEEPIWYTNMTYNYMNRQLQMKKGNELIEQINTLEKQKGQTAFVKYFIAAFFRIQSFVNNGEYSQARHYILSNKLEDKWPMHQAEGNRQMVYTCYYVVATIFLITQNFKSSEKWCKKLMSEIIEDTLSNLKICAQIMRLLCQYEHTHKTSFSRAIFSIKSEIEHSSAPEAFKAYTHRLLVLIQQIMEQKVNTVNLKMEAGALKLEAQNNHNLMVFTAPLSWCLANINGTTMTEEARNL